MLDDYAAHLLSLAPVTGRRLKVVVDAGNGMAGLTAPAVFDRIGAGVDLVPMYFELDGTFPHHEANPIEPANLVDLQRRVLAEGADIGLAFDGDADRCFVVDERGDAVVPVDADRADRGARAGQAARLGGDPQPDHQPLRPRDRRASTAARPVRTRVGHSFIKATMAETDAVFGGEHSGHFYFRDFWRADSGMLAALHTLAALAETDRPLSELLGDYERYVPQRRDQLRGRRPRRRHGRRRDGVRRHRRRRGRPPRRPDRDHARLVVQRPARPTPNPCCASTSRARDEATMTRVRDDVLALIRSHR